MQNISLQNFVSFLLIFVIASCQNRAANELEDDENDSTALYYDCRVSAEEGGDSVTVVVQYRQGGKTGEGVLLPLKDSITLDGKSLQADSAKSSGVFYEGNWPVSNFTGEHYLTLSGGNDEKNEQEFSFQPFGLETEMAEQIKKAPFTIKLKNFSEAPSRIQLVITDTSFASQDVNEEMEIENGKIQVTKAHLARLVKGPVTLEIYYDEEKPLKGLPQNGGRLLISYGLKRQFGLVE